MTNKQQPWKQQPTESDLLYSYYELYQQQPTTNRSIKKVKETLHQQGKKLTYEYLRTISSEYKWQDRVRAYDQHYRALVESSKESSIKEMNNRHQDIGSKCIAIIDDQLSDPDILNADPVKRCQKVNRNIQHPLDFGRGKFQLHRFAVDIGIELVRFHLNNPVCCCNCNLF